MNGKQFEHLNPNMTSIASLAQSDLIGVNDGLATDQTPCQVCRFLALCHRTL